MPAPKDITGEIHGKGRARCLAGNAGGSRIWEIECTYCGRIYNQQVKDFIREGYEWDRRKRDKCRRCGLTGLAGTHTTIEVYEPLDGNWPTDKWPLSSPDDTDTSIDSPEWK